ncbi:SDR family NAD(P)-dependent oxidoreductase [Vibrio sp. SM6]|uniref:SDR family NAD(P)-dependent oxidoreductase n=1 Tax=Vibrio agarilyticus TaxID=2726741 RepID=A0A7X8TQ25_9VIBR|nr:SDR family NAD(P)-dependent oxidoreductase [Vibrio agarilyticus]NLS12768.1 SDR family NAD(P)-dependent oxidoreductase [Vibrio agarilyticus]
MNEKIVLITGATDGIGKYAAMALAKMGYHIILHGRNREKILATASTIQNSVPGCNIDWVEADFESLPAIKKMSQELHEKYDRIDVLVNNVGAQFHELRFADEGVEVGFAVNHIAPFLLTSSIIDLLLKSECRRIINVSSEMHRNMQYFHFDYIYGKEAYSLYDYYSNTKLANLLFSYKLSRVLEGKGFTVLAITPGLTDTHLNPQRTPELVQRAVPVELGAVSMIEAVTSPSLQGKNAIFLDKDAQVEPTSSASYDIEQQDKLWDMTEKLLGMKFTVL